MSLIRLGPSWEALVLNSKPTDGRSVRCLQTRAVRSAIGKAVIGDDGTASSSRPVKPLVSPGSPTGQPADAMQAVPIAAGRDLASQICAQQASDRSSLLSRRGSVDPQLVGPSSPVGDRHNGDTSDSMSSEHAGSRHWRSASGGLTHGGGSPHASVSRGASSNVGSLPVEDDAVLGPTSQSIASQFSEQATQVDTPLSPPDASGSMSRSGSLHRQHSGIQAPLFDSLDLYGGSAQEPAATVHEGG